MTIAMTGRRWICLWALIVALACAASAQTRKALTNDDVVNMTKQGFDSSLIVKTIQTSQPNFDVSPQALIDLKNAGVSQSVMEAMLSAESAQPAAAGGESHGVTAMEANAGADPTRPQCAANGCLLRDATEVPLKFAADLNSKTASDGDSVEFVLADDLKVGDVVVAKKDSHATATVSNAKRAGMMGKPGELNVQLQYLIAGDNHVRLRGTKGSEGDSKTGAAVALTVLFGPVGLIKHGKNVDIPAGTALTAYVDQDVWLPAVAGDSTTAVSK
jgi:hypothetical protein